MDLNLEKKGENKTPVNEELETMALISNALKNLDEDARSRVLLWVNNKFKNKPQNKNLLGF